MTNREMAARMAVINTTGTWNVYRTFLRPEPSPRKEEDTTDILIADEDDDLLMKPKKAKPRHVEMRRMIASALHVFQYTTLNYRIDVMEGAKVVSPFETANHKAAEREKIFIHQEFENIVRRFNARCAANEVIILKIGRLTELQGLIQHLTKSLIKIRCS